MPDEPPSRGPATSLKGWLSDLFFQAILEGASAPLLSRLGPKATLDHPLFGRAAGADEVRAMVARIAKLLEETQASYTRAGGLIGFDRDVAEGSLMLLASGQMVALPVAIVAERRRSREVELRVYHATRTLGVEAAPRAAPDLHPAGELSLPRVVQANLAAAARRDASGVLATFEEQGRVRDAAGTQHRKEGGGLATFYAARTGTEQLRAGPADDGRTCALEFTRIASDGAARSGLAIYERGDSGLLREVRLYEEVEPT